jgi:hypothetical protein
VAAAEAGTNYLADAEMAAILAELGPVSPEPDAPAQSAKVVGARFGSPLAVSEGATRGGIPEEYLKNMDRALGRKAAEGG